MRKKSTTLLIFPDRRARLSGWISLLTVLFRISFVLSILAGALFLIALILWPIIWFLLIICTLGLILMADGLSGAPALLTSLLPIMIVLACIAIGLWIARYALEWLIILRQSHVLKRDPERNKHHLNVARVVRKMKLFDLGVLIVTVVSFIVAVVFGWQLKDGSTDTAATVVPIIMACIIIVAFVASKVFASKQLKKVKSDVQEIYKVWYQQPVTGETKEVKSETNV